MTEEELKFIAAELIHDTAEDFEFLTIVEVYPELADGDANRVYDLINEATIKVEWND